MILCWDYSAAMILFWESSVMNSKQWPALAALFLLSACGFLRDNEERALTLQFKTDASVNQCPKLSTLGDDINAADFAKFSATVDCHKDGIKNSMKRVIGAKSEQLNPSELRALLNAFYFDKTPLEKAEVLALLTIRDLINPGNSGTLHYREFDEIANSLKASFEDLRSFNHGRAIGDTENELDLQEWTAYPTRAEILLRIIGRNRFTTESISSEEVFGLIKMAKRISSGDRKTFLSNIDRSHVDTIYPLLKSVLGFEQIDEISLRGLNFASQLARQIGDYRALDSRMKLRAEGDESNPGNPIEVNSPLFLQHQKLTDEIVESLLRITGFQSGGRMTRQRFESAIADFNDKTFQLPGGKSIDLDLDQKFISRVLFDTKENFIGFGSEVIGAESMREIGRHMFNFFRSETADLQVTPDELKNPLSVNIVRYPTIVSFVQQEWNNLLLSEFYPETALKNQIDLGDAVMTFYQQALLSAFLKTYDDNENGMLDITSDSHRDEFKKVIKSLAQSYTGLRIYTSESNGGKESLAEQTRQSASLIREIIESPKTFAALVLFADNLSPHSNSDGAINGAELLQVVKLVDTFVRQRSVFQGLSAEVDDKNLLPFAAFMRIKDTSNNYSYFELLENTSQLRVLFGTGENYIDIQAVLRAVSGTEHAADFEQRMKELYGVDSITKRDELEQAFQNFALPLQSSLNSVLPHFWPENSTTISDDSLLMLVAFNATARGIFGTAHPQFRRGSDSGQTPPEVNTADDSEQALEFARVTFTEIQSYFSNRFRGQSFSWLPPKVRLAILSSPKGTSSELMSRLFWHAPEILKHLQIAKAAGSNTDYSAVLKKAFEQASDTNGSLSLSELFDRAHAAAAVLQTAGRQ